VDACEGAREESGSTSKEAGGAADDRPGMDFVGPEGPESIACGGSEGDFIVAVDEEDSVEALFSSSGSSLISEGGALSPFMLDM
jgi:hypothetical protein